MKRLFPLIKLLSVISIGCAPAEFKDGPDTAVFRPYVEEFNSAYAEELGGEPREVIFFFAELSGKAAECIKVESGERIVNVNSVSWEWYTKAQKRSLIWHELGHCVLDRGHVEGEDAISHMYPSVQISEFIEENEVEMDFEMFNPNELRTQNGRTFQKTNRNDEAWTMDENGECHHRI